MKIEEDYNDLDDEAEEVNSGDEVGPLEGLHEKQDGAEGGSASEITY